MASHDTIMPRFDEFACIDWSGANTRWHKGIAVASCAVGDAAPALIQPQDPHWTRGAVLDWLRQQAHEKRNMLIGLDLSLALPFADKGAYFPGWDASPANALQLWHCIDQLCETDDHLSATSFIQHAEVSRHFRQQGNCGDLFGTGRGRLRVCEADGQALIDGINPYSCFNLVGAAQVGKSSLTGMRVLHQLRGSIPIWPFDPLPESGPVIVEIYTSIAARASGVLPGGKSKITDGATLDNALARFRSGKHSAFSAGYTDHATDAILTAAWLRHVADKERLWKPAKMTLHISQTEGWTFGVV
jgi:hypothetical protein